MFESRPAPSLPGSTPNARFAGWHTSKDAGGACTMRTPLGTKQGLPTHLVRADAHRAVRCLAKQRWCYALVQRTRALLCNAAVTRRDMTVTRRDMTVTRRDTTVTRRDMTVTRRDMTECSSGECAPATIVRAACSELWYLRTAPSSPWSCRRTLTTSMGTVDSSAVHDPMPENTKSFHGASVERDIFAAAAVSCGSNWHVPATPVCRGDRLWGEFRV